MGRATAGIIFSPIAGSLSDKYGRRALLVVIPPILARLPFTLRPMLCAIIIAVSPLHSVCPLIKSVTYQLFDHCEG